MRFHMIEVNEMWACLFSKTKKAFEYRRSSNLNMENSVWTERETTIAF